MTDLDDRLRQLVEKNKKVITFCLFDSQGQPQGTYSRQDLDAGQKNRLAAAAMACVTLSTRVVDNLTQDQVQVVEVGGEVGNVAVGVTTGGYSVVVTQPSVNARQILTQLIANL